MAANPLQTLASRLPKGVMRVATAVAGSALWMTVSSALILLNRHLMVEHKFNYPMALSGLGMVFSSVASFVYCKVFHLREASKVVTWRFYFRQILPIGLFMALTLFTGNLVYLYLTVSFIQMLKAFCPIITMLALFIAQLESPSQNLVSAVLLITLGTALASYGELNFSVVGVLIMLSSETCESIRLVMTQVLLVGLKFHPMEGLMYLAPACSLWLGLGAAAMEARRMVEEGALNDVAAHPWMYLAAASMGFGVNITAYIVILTASSLTLKVLATVKNALLVWLGIVFLHDQVTGLQALGYAVSIGGFVLYNHVKMAQIAGGVEGAGQVAHSAQGKDSKV